MYTTPTQVTQQAQDLDLQKRIGYPTDVVTCSATSALHQPPESLAQSGHVRAQGRHPGGVGLHDLGRVQKNKSEGLPSRTRFLVP